MFKGFFSRRLPLGRVLYQTKIRGRRRSYHDNEIQKVKLKDKSQKQHNTTQHLSAVAELFLNNKGFEINQQDNKTITRTCRFDNDINNERNTTLFDDHDDDVEEYEEVDPTEYAEGELEDHIEDVMAVQNTQYSEQLDIAERTKDIKSGTPDPKIPMSSVPCQGCGAFFHCKDASIPGYLPSERFTSLTKQQLKHSLCQRCNLMFKYNICLNVKSTEEEFQRVIAKINEEISLIILIVDITDIRNSLMPHLFKLLKNHTRPIFIVGNKVDSIPVDEPGYLKRIQNTLIQECNRAGLNPSGKNIKYIGLVSAKTGYGIEDLISNLMVQWKYNGNVYLLGNTNVGKSTLFNALLQSDYCKSRARDIIHRATVSVWPGTTISTLKFPILNPKSWRMQMREKRLKRDKVNLLEERKLQKSIVNEQENMRNKWKSATLSGYLGITDFQEDDSTPNLYVTPSFEMKYDSLICNIGRDHILSLPSAIDFDEPEYQKFNCWLFDTPGVIIQQQIINLMNQLELTRLLPTEVVPPRVYILKKGQSMFITSLGRIDYVEGDHPLFMTVHVTSNIKVHIRNKDEADIFYRENYGRNALQVPVGDMDRLNNIPSLVGREYYLTDYLYDKAIADIQLSSLGWVSVAKYKNFPVRLRAYTPGARGLYLREPSLLPNIKTFRGKRIGGKQEYRCKPPKVL